MNRNKSGSTYFFPLLVFSMITLVGIGYYVFKSDQIKPSPQVSVSPTPPTTDWKTYKNQEYGFKFKYPPDWIIQPVASENTIGQFGEYFEGGEPGGSSPLYLYISIKPYETIFAQDIKNDGTEVINHEKVKIDDKIYDLNTHKQFEVEAAYKIIDYIPIKDINRADLYLYFSHTNTGCSILPADTQDECLKVNDKNNVIYRNIRNQILSTFKFIDNESSEGKFCGGIANIQCPDGYKCKLEGNYPDAGGICITN